MIESGRYRIAMMPAMSGPTYHAAKNASKSLQIWIVSGGAKADVSSDFYHVACFEKIADLSKADFLDRISPATRSTCHIRNLKGASIPDGNYLCEGGVERLVLEWKVQRGGWTDEREGKKVDSLEETLPEFNNLLRKAGSSKFRSGRFLGRLNMNADSCLPPLPRLEVMDLRTPRNGISLILFLAKIRRVGMSLMI
jgi:hypothetical protein